MFEKTKQKKRINWRPQPIKKKMVQLNERIKSAKMWNSEYKKQTQ